MPFLQKCGKLRKDGKAKSTKTRAKPYWYIHVPTDHGFKSLSTGTTDKKTAQRMELMVDDLHRGRNRDPELLAWLIDRSLPRAERLKPLALLDAYDNNQLDALKAERAARLNPPAEAKVEDVNGQVERWFLGVKGRSSTDHADRFRRAVRSFVPADEVVPPSRFTHAALLDWTNSLQEATENDGLGLSANTARRYEWAS